VINRHASERSYASGVDKDIPELNALRFRTHAHLSSGNAQRDPFVSDALLVDHHPRTVFGVLRRNATSHYRRKISDILDRPLLGNQTEGRPDQDGVVVARVAEVDEPLAIDRPRHLLQHLNPPSVVLDQVI